jgi:hypothetical protein
MRVILLLDEKNKAVVACILLSHETWDLRLGLMFQAERGKLYYIFFVVY